MCPPTHFEVLCGAFGGFGWTSLLQLSATEALLSGHEAPTHFPHSLLLLAPAGQDMWSMLWGRVGVSVCVYRNI